MGRYTAEQTHRIMSAIKSKDTKPELILRKEIWKHGLRYRTNYSKLQGKPDLAFTRAKLAVFVDGDFWHGHNWVLRGLPSFEEELKRYSDYWKLKIVNNVKRDAENNQKLEASGWKVLRFWESDIKKDLDRCVDTIVKEYKERIQS